MCAPIPGRANKISNVEDTKASFLLTVYNIVSAIPEGRVATYGQIALLAGRPNAPRMVGYAMSRAPLELPCHRVVSRQGKMAPIHAFGGQDIQRRLLEREGITFLQNGCIDIKKHVWKPDAPAAVKG